MAPRIWLSLNLASEWYEDALAEARIGGDYRNRRREILFAVCAAESYLLEWVRDGALAQNFPELKQYFPPGARRGVAEKWKAVLKQLKSDGRILAVPNLDDHVWQDFIDLLDYRDGLVHAKASRPWTKALPAEEQPLPSKTDLDGLAPGWAVRIVKNLITRLHATMGTHIPVWLVEP